ncbi:UNVERIFIED_CONTAM: hypothetical protein FKN15_043835 [Acipenser sinensis]
MEHERRGAGETTPSHQIFGARIVPNYKLFLKGSANKATLAEFVSKYLASQAPAHLPEAKSIVIAGGFADGKRVMHLTYSGGAALENMFSTQEEADTRMVLHAISLSKDHYRVIVLCDDTDVLIILIYYFCQGLLAQETNIYHIQQISALYSRPPHSTDGSPSFTITDLCSLQQTTTLYRWQSIIHYYRSLLSTADHHTLPMAVHHSLLQISALYSRPPHSTDGSPSFTITDLCSLQQTTTLYRWQSIIHYYRSLLSTADHHTLPMAVHHSLLQISALYSRPPHSTDGSPSFTITDLCSLQQTTTLYRWQSIIHYYRSLLSTADHHTLPMAVHHSLLQISALYSRPPHSTDGSPSFTITDLCSLQQTTTLYRWQSIIHYYRSLLSTADHHTLPMAVHHSLLQISALYSRPPHSTDGSPSFTITDLCSLQQTTTLYRWQSIIHYYRSLLSTADHHTLPMAVHHSLLQISALYSRPPHSTDGSPSFTITDLCSLQQTTTLYRWQSIIHYYRSLLSTADHHTLPMAVHHSLLQISALYSRPPHSTDGSPSFTITDLCSLQQTTTLYRWQSIIHYYRSLLSTADHHTLPMAVHHSLLQISALYSRPPHSTDGSPSFTITDLCSLQQTTTLYRWQSIIHYYRSLLSTADHHTLPMAVHHSLLQISALYSRPPHSTDGSPSFTITDLCSLQQTTTLYRWQSIIHYYRSLLSTADHHTLPMAVHHSLLQISALYSRPPHSTDGSPSFTITDLCSLQQTTTLYRWQSIIHYYRSLLSTADHHTLPMAVHHSLLQISALYSRPPHSTDGSPSFTITDLCSLQQTTTLYRWQSIIHYYRSLLSTADHHTLPMAVHHSLLQISALYSRPPHSTDGSPSFTITDLCSLQQTTTLYRWQSIIHYYRSLLSTADHHTLPMAVHHSLLQISALYSRPPHSTDGSPSFTITDLCSLQQTTTLYRWQSIIHYYRSLLSTADHHTLPMAVHHSLLQISALYSRPPHSTDGSPSFTITDLCSLQQTTTLYRWQSIIHYYRSLLSTADHHTLPMAVHHSLLQISALYSRPPHSTDGSPSFTITDLCSLQQTTTLYRWQSIIHYYRSLLSTADHHTLPMAVHHSLLQISALYSRPPHSTDGSPSFTITDLCSLQQTTTLYRWQSIIHYYRSLLSTADHHTLPMAVHHSLLQISALYSRPPHSTDGSPSFTITDLCSLQQTTTLYRWQSIIHYYRSLLSTADHHTLPMAVHHSLLQISALYSRPPHSTDGSPSFTITDLCSLQQTTTLYRWQSIIHYYRSLLSTADHHTLPMAVHHSLLQISALYSRPPHSTDGSPSFTITDLCSLQQTTTLYRWQSIIHYYRSLLSTADHHTLPMAVHHSLLQISALYSRPPHSTDGSPSFTITDLCSLQQTTTLYRWQSIIHYYRSLLSTADHHTLPMAVHHSLLQISALYSRPPHSTDGSPSFTITDLCSLQQTTTLYRWQSIIHYYRSLLSTADHHTLPMAVHHSLLQISALYSRPPHSTDGSPSFTITDLCSLQQTTTLYRWQSIIHYYRSLLSTADHHTLPMAVHHSLLQISALYSRPPHSTDGSPSFTITDLCSLQQTTTLYRWQSIIHYYRSLLSTADHHTLPMAVHHSLLQISALYSRPPHSTDGSPSFTITDLCSLQQTTTLYRWQSIIHYYRSLLSTADHHTLPMAVHHSLLQISALYSRPPHSTDGSPSFTITDLCSLQQTTTLYRWQSIIHYYRSLLSTHFQKMECKGC